MYGWCPQEDQGVDYMHINNIMNLWFVQVCYQKIQDDIVPNGRNG